MNKKQEYLTGNSEQTRRIGGKLAKEVIKRPLKREAFVIGLKGELGSGKTTFLQGFARGLGIKEKILSPTFLIFKKFQILSRHSRNSRDKFQAFYHIDCYRIKNEKDLSSLGIREIISNPENIVAVEWPEKIEKILPRQRLSIKFKFVSENKRKIVIKP